MSIDNSLKEITEKEAIRNATTKLGLQPSTPGRAWRVRRLDRPPEVYYLVEMGAAGHLVALCVLDAHTGEAGIFASLTGVESHITLEAEVAKELAGGGEDAHAELVWKPCAASRSPLYPLWEVRTQAGIKYVDQQRKVHDKIEPARPGE